MASEASTNSYINKQEIEILRNEVFSYTVDSLLPITIRDYVESKIQESRSQAISVMKRTLDDRQVIIKSGIIGKMKHFNEIIHEAFVGLHGINKLQSPNFVRILGMNIATNCNDVYPNESCSYLISEYIHGPALEDYLEGADPEVFKKVLLDIIEALYLAYKKLDFTHYDLHLRNIIVTYGDIPVIIDYGTSHIKYHGQSFGQTWQTFGIANRSNWAYDVFKLIINLVVLLDLDSNRHHWKARWTRKYSELEDEIRIYGDDPEARAEIQAKIDHTPEYPYDYPYQLSPILLGLLQFFGTGPLSHGKVRHYFKTYAYGQLSPRMGAVSHDFDLFIERARDRLKPSAPSALAPPPSRYAARSV